MIPEPNTLEARLARLETLSLAELRSAWCEQFGKDVPISASRKLLRRAVGHRMQELERGGLRPETRRLIEQLMASLASGGALPSRVLGRRPPAKPGTRLLRSWKGELHEVAVLTDGFLWHGERHTSLSAIARIITGRPRNGPAFFGLRRDASVD